MHELEGMKICVDAKKVLETVRENRGKHRAIVEEARVGRYFQPVGYVEAARAAVEKRLDKLAAGKVVSLVFSLIPPRDHTRAYDTIIRMLELHTEETVSLTASQVRNFVMDEWDWKGSFLSSNAAYSKMAADELGEGDEG